MPNAVYALFLEMICALATFVFFFSSSALFSIHKLWLKYLSENTDEAKRGKFIRRFECIIVWKADHSRISIHNENKTQILSGLCCIFFFFLKYIQGKTKRWQILIKATTSWASIWQNWSIQTLKNEGRARYRFTVIISKHHRSIFFFSLFETCRTNYFVCHFSRLFNFPRPIFFSSKHSVWMSETKVFHLNSKCK